MPNAKAIICPASGTAVISVPAVGGGEETTYTLSGHDKHPIESPGIHLGMYFQGPSVPLESRDIKEEYPFPELHKELKQIQSREDACLHILMCIDPDISLETRLELCEEIKDDFDDKALRVFVLKRIQERLSDSSKIALEGLPTEGNLGRIFNAIKHMIAV